MYTVVTRENLRSCHGYHGDHQEAEKQRAEKQCAEKRCARTSALKGTGTLANEATFARLVREMCRIEEAGRARGGVNRCVICELDWSGREFKACSAYQIHSYGRVLVSRRSHSNAAAQ